MLLLNLRRESGPLYRRIYRALKSSIHGGRLGPAARLPSTRTLAADLGVSRNTVMLAYEQLAAEGYVVGRQRSSTAVARKMLSAALTAARSSAMTKSAEAFRLRAAPASERGRSGVLFRAHRAALRLSLRPSRGR
jgi:GntR family transcriptional regulator/MocR family aminotransferase